MSLWQRLTRPQQNPHYGEYREPHEKYAHDAAERPPGSKQAGHYKLRGHNVGDREGMVDWGVVSKILNCCMLRASRNTLTVTPTSLQMHLSPRDEN